MAKIPARRRRLLAHQATTRSDRLTDYARSSLPHRSGRAADGDLVEDAATDALLPAPVEADEPEPRPMTAVERFPHALPPVRSNPGPLPDPLPPRLDEAVRRLREDLLTAGGEAAGLADEICARHRDRLREALGLSE